MTLGFSLLLKTQLFCFLHVSPASSVLHSQNYHTDGFGNVCAPFILGHNVDRK